jgi:hypothetical protein
MAIHVTPYYLFIIVCYYIQAGASAHYLRGVARISLADFAGASADLAAAKSVNPTKEVRAAQKTKSFRKTKKQSRNDSYNN